MALEARDLWMEWTNVEPDGLTNVRLTHQPTRQAVEASVGVDETPLEVQTRLVAELTVLVEADAPHPETLEGAEAAWKALLAPTLDTLESVESVWEQHVALVAVRELLFGHHPVADSFSPHPVCACCMDARHDRPERWPCDVYQVIEKASRHGE
jgi:hypothetical protein